uniref:Uncharacterized protein n=1 Tax=viral metagenome TaxID=1070528 RepID=A0A6H1ZKT7_9ZZZZ
MVGLIWNNIAPANVNLPYNLINMLLKEPHTWTGTQTFKAITIDSTYFDVDAGGLTTYGTSGNSTFSVDGAGNVMAAGTLRSVGAATFDSTVTAKGNIQANESLGGTSTYAIHGNVNLNSLASATQALLTAGRIINIDATASPIVKLPDMTSLSSVTNDMLFADITSAGNASGVTLFSSSDIVSGLGSTYVVTGGTVFVNGGASGNSGYTVQAKAFNYKGTLKWRVWTDADVIRRP